MSQVQPPKRYSHAFFTIDNYFFIYGGLNNEVVLDDMWAFNVLTREWNQIEQPAIYPGPRSSTQLVRYGRSAFMFSGYTTDGSTCRQDLWRFDFDTTSWTNLIPTNGTMPIPRISFCMRVVRNYLVMFGGATCNSEILRAGSRGTPIL